MTEPVASFLRNYPPFRPMKRTAVDRLAAQIKIRYVEANEVVFSEGDEASGAFFVVRKGLVALRRGAESEGELLDLCDDGDLFGVRALLDDNRYSATAEAREDGLLYVVPWAAFEDIMRDDPRVSMFLAAGFAAELPKVRDKLLEATSEARRKPVDGPRPRR